MFQVRPFETKTCSWWYSQREEIDLEPPYQRKGNLWTREKKAFLIDSILNGFDFPKIYIADFTYVNTPLNEKNKSYAVIDGKQRLETIYSFFDGTLNLSRNFIYFNNINLNLSGLSYHELLSKHPKVASDFENFNVSAVSVITDDEALLNELFVRMNSSKPLTGAEIRNAMPGGIPKLIKNIARHTFYTRSINFSTKNGQDLNSAAKLLLIEYRGKLVSTKRKDLDDLVYEHHNNSISTPFVNLIAASQSDSSAIHRAIKRVERNLNIMTDIFNDKDSLLNKPGVLTVYYWFVRNCKDEQKRFIRNFLEDFEYRLKQHKGKLRAGHDDQNDKLSYYLTLSRSVNDQASLNAMHAILSEYFEAYLLDMQGHGN